METHHSRFSTPNVMAIFRLGPPPPLTGHLMQWGMKKSRFSTSISIQDTAIVTMEDSSSSSIGACRWRCCSCECPPTCSVLSSPKPWREAKIKLAHIFLDPPPSLARYVLDDLDAACSSLGQAICRLVEHGNDLETCRPGPRGQTTSGVWSAQCLIADGGLRIGKLTQAFE